MVCMKGQHRLKRRIIGERLHRVRPVEERAEERRHREGPPQIEVPERYNGMTFAVRKIRRMANPEPNAPQLVRLVRHPFALDRGYFSRRKVTDFDLARAERRPYREGFEAGMEAAQRRPLLQRPTEVHIRPEPRVRLSIEQWLRSEGRQDG